MFIFSAILIIDVIVRCKFTRVLKISVDMDTLSIKKYIQCSKISMRGS